MQIVLSSRSRSYDSNLVTLGITTLLERRNELVRNFAISCFRSQEHRWWFSPHPPLPLNTRLDPPRFSLPFSKRDRDLKRPIVKYTEILNSLTDEEWERLRLPSPTTAVFRPNLQLPNLADPQHKSLHCHAQCSPVLHPIKSQLGPRPQVKSFEPRHQSALSVLSHPPGDVHSSVQEHSVLGDCGVDKYLPMQCHDVCFPGLGGDIVCLYDDDETQCDAASDDVNACSPTLNPVLGEPDLSTPRHTILHSSHSRGDPGLAHPLPNLKPGSGLEAVNPSPPCSPIHKLERKLTRYTNCVRECFYLLQETVHTMPNISLSLSTTPTATRAGLLRSTESLCTTPTATTCRTTSPTLRPRNRRFTL